MNRLLKFGSVDRWCNLYPALPRRRIVVPRIIFPRPHLPRHTKEVILNCEPPERPFEVLCKLQANKKWKYIGRLQ